MNISRNRLRYTAGVAAIIASSGIASAAFSQSAANQPQAPSASDQTVMMGDVVVTARKRVEKVQDVPISISAFSGQSLAARGIEKIDGISNITPNMTFQNNPSFGGADSSAAIYIRGIGQKEFLPTTEPGVGVYVDGVYVARSVGSLLDLVDVDRVEVLRGPQGTLFGRNTIGGAVSLTTAPPTNHMDASLEATGGSYGRFDVKGMINAPVTDRLYIKFSGAHFGRNGYVKHLSDGRELGDQNSYTGRVDVLWKPTDSLKVDLAADYTKSRTNGPALVLSGVNYKSAIFNPSSLPVLPPGSPATPGSYVLNPPYDAPTDNFTLLANYFATFLGGQPCISLSPYNPQASNAAGCFSNRFLVGSGADAGTGAQYSRQDILGAQSTVTWDIGKLQLKSISAARGVNGEYARDGDHSSLTILQLADILKQRQVSQEFQVTGAALGGRLKYLAGLYYFNEWGRDTNLLDFTPVTFRSGGDFETKSYAAFTQATWTILPRVDLTAGVRYTEDDKSFLPDQVILVDKTGGALIAASPNTPQIRIVPFERVRQSEQAATPMVNLSWRPASDLMLYASYSQGFKSGGFVQRVFPAMTQVPRFNAEKATAYELGFKSMWLRHRLTLNGSAFFTQYDNLQVQVFTGIAPVTQNAAAAEIKGAELEGKFAVGAGWFVESSLGYIDARYTKISPTATEITRSSKFERVPKWTANASVTKSVSLGDFGDATARVDWSYRSGQYMDALNTPELYQPAYGLVNASLAYQPPHSPIKVTIGATNLGGTRYEETGIYGSSFGLYEKMFARSREYYVSLKWKL